ncbi:cationic amino acid transporter 9, chloroplastic isoform X2 [Gossypium hirsutum]|uniref:Cationic amino acid transporter 9, chloroplastic isoform X2 n=1 Tax=Gossypium hirsutum TaxID=3635 RepID=A0ABM2YIC4_GOSHI|nr:cationic amino acid transporter 9, chloroplastic isoform X2 [Gossypium hirsutum]
MASTMDDSRHKDATSSSTCFSHFCSSALRAKTLKSSSSTNNSSDGLIRRLGVFDLILLGVGASIGAGIFVVTGTVARDAGPGVTISFILAGASCVLNALCYAELASRFPAVVGGAYLYAYTAFNEITAFLVFMQLMLDYHIGAASIARSLASYVATIFELIPALKGNIPPWVGHGGQEFFGGTLSINILAPILLAVLTVILCLGVGESSAVNSFMTAAKVVIVIFVIIVGSFKVDVDNWSPFAPNGVKHIFTGATVVFFAYVGFDAVANSAEESKRPQYWSCCWAYNNPSSWSICPVYMMECFSEQSRLYLGLGRDGLLPSIFAKVHPIRHTPIHSQIWVGIIAAVLGGLFNVHILSHILSVGSLTGYSVVAACVVTLRWKNNTGNRVSSKCISTWCEGVLCIFLVACCGFAAGVLYRFGTHFIFMIVAVVIAIMACAALCFRQAYSDPPGFSCPWVPIVPSVCIFFNIYLFAQLHYEAWIRFIILSIVSVGIYAFYGQYHANPRLDETIIYHMAPEEDRH